MIAFEQKPVSLELSIEMQKDYIEEIRKALLYAEMYLETLEKQLKDVE